MASGIYIITCLSTNKHYIGYSCDIERRLDEHRKSLRNQKHRNCYLQDAFNKHCEENFTFDPLEYYPEEFLASFEHWWCNMLNVHNGKYGYNIKPTHPYDESGQAEETRQKISRKNKGRVFTQDWKNKLSERAKGRKASDATKQKLSKLHTGRYVSNDTRKLLSEINKGHKWGMAGKSHNDATKILMSLKQANGGYRTGIPHTKESKDALLLSRSKFYANKYGVSLEDYLAKYHGKRNIKKLI